MCRPLSLSLLLTYLFLPATLSLGQPTPPPPAEILKDSGTKPWVVIKGDLRDATGLSDALVADFESKEQAQACAARLNAAEKDPQWMYAYRLRNPVASPVAGRVFQGRIGKYHVSLQFADTGQFSVSGEMEGQGTWTQSGGGLLLETPVAKLRGNVEGDKITGLRFVKDASEPAMSWSVKECCGSKMEPVGRWTDQTAGPRSQTTVTLVLRPDYSGTWIHDVDYIHASTGGMTHERLMQFEIRWRMEKEPGTDAPQIGILIEPVNGPRPWDTKWIEVTSGALEAPWQRAS
jgi:hypothetical protein